MDFDKVLSNLKRPVPNRTYMQIVLLLLTRKWTELRRLIRTLCLSGGNIWVDGYPLLDRIIQIEDVNLFDYLVKLFFSLRSVPKDRDFRLLQFIFYIAIINKDGRLIDILVSVGVNVNDLLDRETPLCSAIRTNAGRDIISLIIDHGACVNGYGRTPLSQVFGSLQCDLDVAELLVSHGADVNRMYADSRSETLVNFVCQMQNSEGLKWLLAHNADPNSYDRIGQTGLHIAARKGDVSCVKTLLQYGGSPNAVNGLKETPLIIAVETNNTAIAELLLQHGAILHSPMVTKAFRKITEINYGSFLEMVSSMEQCKMLKILINYRFVFRLNIYEREGIHAAARNGDLSIVKTFLKAGLSPNSVFLNTPLLFDAIKGKNTDLVALLLDSGSDTSYKDDSGVVDSALNVSVSSNTVEVTELLFSRGHTDLSQSCIFKAVENLNIKMLKVLVKFGVNVIVKDEQYLSPLHCVIRSTKYVGRTKKDVDLEKAEIVKFLLDQDASIVSWKITGLNKDPIHYAIAFDYVEVVKVLLEAGTSFEHLEEVGNNLLPSTILHFAAKFRSNKMVEALLDKGASVHALQFSGKTPLQIAVETKAVSVIRVLLENGAEIRRRTSCNQNLLFYAVANSSSKEVVAELLKFGIDVDSRGGCNSDMTALHMACHLGNGDLVSVLLDHCADVNAVDINGNTPFMVSKKTLLAMHIVAQGNWFGYKNGEYIAGPSTPLYHLQRHAFKMNFLGLPLHPCFKPVLELKFSEKFVGRCKRELKRMKTVKINDASCLFIYDIIKQKEDPGYVTNIPVLTALNGDKQLFKKFTFFRGILKDCIKKAELRCELFDVGQKFLSDVLGCSCLNYLPNEIIRFIMSYLKNEELLILREP